RRGKRRNRRDLGNDRRLRERRDPARLRRRSFRRNAADRSLPGARQRADRSGGRRARAPGGLQWHAARRHCRRRRLPVPGRREPGVGPSTGVQGDSGSAEADAADSAEGRRVRRAVLLTQCALSAASCCAEWPWNFGANCLSPPLASICATCSPIVTGRNERKSLSKKASISSSFLVNGSFMPGNAARSSSSSLPRKSSGWSNSEGSVPVILHIAIANPRYARASASENPPR